MDKISAVYKIVNTVTGEFYIGSSVDVKRRWASHKCPSTWKKQPNSPMYKTMQKYGVKCFSFEILKEVEPENLKQEEQNFIEMLNPVYNNNNAKGLDTERAKLNLRKAKEKYFQSEKGKANQKKYYSQLCEYNGETLTLCALIQRFHRAGISHPTQEAKKYLISK